MSEANNTPETPDVAEQSAQLQIGDIEAAVKVIDYASEQGAFRGWQVVSEVLTLRNRLVHFVRAAQPQEVPVADAESVTDTTENTSGVPESPAADGSTAA